MPAPRIEFRLLAGAQADVAVATDKAQQKPDLLLSAIVAAPVRRSTDRARRSGAIRGYGPGCARDARSSPLLLQLAIHRHFRRLTDLIPPCGKCHECSLTRLPQKTSFFQLQMMMPTLGISVTIYHVDNPISSSIHADFSTFHAQIKHRPLPQKPGGIVTIGLLQTSTKRPNSKPY